MSDNWVPLESSPEVLTEYWRELGLDPKYQFVDIISFDEEPYWMPGGSVPAAILLLYEVNPDIDASTKRHSTVEADPSVFRARQTVGNACGTVALFHMAGNIPGSVTDAGGPAQAYFATVARGTEQSGELLRSCGPISSLHRAAACAEGTTQFENEECATEGVDLHYIALMPLRGVDGKLHVGQLDGRCEDIAILGPETTEESWVKDTFQWIRENYWEANESGAMTQAALALVSE